MTELETQMILAARRGKAEGYRYLMNRYGRQVQLLVGQMVKDVRDAEELAQDVFVRAFEHLADFDPERASFSTWLSRIAHNTALNHLRSRGFAPLPLDEEYTIHNSQFTIHNSPFTPPDGVSWAQDTDELASEADRLALLDEAIDHLRPEERSLLHLRYYEGRSLGEIAEVMTVREGPLANRLQRIRKKLKKIMGNFSHMNDHE
ncbi:MAG: RNA polymerase sigma factor [Bacteroidaceae bacterium]|nr:RNA polymerase sigma factor [Bacteroidaceae bacterium]